MRTRSLGIVALIAAGCSVRLPRGIAVPIATNLHVQAHVQVHVQVQAPPPPPPPLVEIEGAPVVEFFGIPLDGAQDVVFVFDCSGSMADPAQGRLAQIHGGPPGPPPGPPPPPPYGSQPPPPPSTTPAGPPPSTMPPSPVTTTSTMQPPPATEPPPPPPGPRKLDIAQDELVDALEHLPAGTRMNVIFFNNDLEAFAPSIVPLDDASRAGLVTFVRATAPIGSTALAPAMRIAFLMNAHRIVLLSDGLGNVGGSADDVLHDAREAIHGGVRIDTVGLGADQDPELLGALAKESGGLYQAM